MTPVSGGMIRSGAGIKCTVSREKRATVVFAGNQERRRGRARADDMKAGLSDASSRA